MHEKEESIFADKNGYSMLRRMYSIIKICLKAINGIERRNFELLSSLLLDFD